MSNIRVAADSLTQKSAIFYPPQNGNVPVLRKLRIITSTPSCQRPIADKLKIPKRLFSNTNQLIKEISEQLGYETQEYYSTSFKKKTGLPPCTTEKKLTFPMLIDDFLDVRKVCIRFSEFRAEVF